LRNVLPQNTRWESFKDVNEFYSADQTLRELSELFDTESDAPGEKPPLPDAIAGMLEKPLALEALGGMLFYIKSLHLDKDLVSQRNFNIYDPIREGKNLVLDGQTLGHMEVSLPEARPRGGETVSGSHGACADAAGARQQRGWLRGHAARASTTMSNFVRETSL
jgi:DNA mismatch repair protein MSH6